MGCCAQWRAPARSKFVLDVVPLEERLGEPEPFPVIPADKPIASERAQDPQRVHDRLGIGTEQHDSIAEVAVIVSQHGEAVGLASTGQLPVADAR